MVVSSFQGSGLEGFHCTFIWSWAIVCHLPHCRYLSVREKNDSDTVILKLAQKVYIGDSIVLFLILAGE